VAMSTLTTEAQRHRENENQKDPRTAPIIGATIEVHRHLGPGLLESAYEEGLCHELHLRGLSFRRQVDLPVAYKGVQLACGYKIDVIVQEEVVLRTEDRRETPASARRAASHLPETIRETRWTFDQLQQSTTDPWDQTNRSVRFFLCVSVTLW